MERIMSVEEKIRRAEEIYERRKQGNTKPVAKVTVSEKKDIRLLKKMLIQILICTLIYLIIYAVQNNQDIFSRDLINKANSILTYDTNFYQLYEGLKNKAIEVINLNTDSDMNNSIGGAVEEESQENLENIVENQENTQQTSELEISQTEQDILDIKNTTTFIKPLEGIISSVYGQREDATGSVPKNHTGTDIAAPMGTKIKSATDGEIVLSSEEGDFGKHLKVQIGEVSIIYAHCNNLYVKQGDKVTQGQEIAEVGSTGNSTGPHLHFEIRISERTINPQSILEL